MDNSGNKLFFGLLVLALFIWGCGASEKAGNEKYLLSAKEFKAQYENDDKGILLDVRTPAEMSKGMIPGAINIDFKEGSFEKNIAELDKGKNYYVYCRTGGRSAKTRTLMNTNGLEKVYDLDGGIVAWLEDGLEVTKE